MNQKLLNIFIVIGIIISLVFPIAAEQLREIGIIGVVEVAIQDQHTEIIDLKLMEKIANITLLQNYSIGDNYINISTDIAPIINNVICLKDRKGSAFLQDKILNVTSLGGSNYQLQLQMPLDFAYTTSDGCSHGSTNWAVDGSVTPRVFSISPALNADTVKWDIIRIMWNCLGDGMDTPGDPTPDSTAFFTMDPLQKGAYLRTKNGITKNIFAAQTNSEMVLRMYDLDINTDINKNGLYSAKARRTFNGLDKNGVTIRLEAKTLDTFDWVVQDNLLDMTLCEAVVQGHVVEN